MHELNKALYLSGLSYPLVRHGGGAQCHQSPQLRISEVQGLLKASVRAEEPILHRQ